MKGKHQSLLPHEKLEDLQVKWPINTVGHQCPKDKRLLMFEFSSDHAHLWAAAFNSAGFQAAVLPARPLNEIAAAGISHVHADLCFG